MKGLSQPSGGSEQQVDIVCDLRDFEGDVSGSGEVLKVWQQISPQLMDKALSADQELSFQLAKGLVKLLVIDPHDVTMVRPNTEFNIIDLLRNPTTRYKCRICWETARQEVYGPFRCNDCDKEGRLERLCEEHTYFIQNALSAYCTDHIPRCECRSDCQQQATFRCDVCHKLFGNHVKYTHPRDDQVLYCRSCYQYRFERCVAVGCNRLGRSQCSYQLAGEEPCGLRLCSEHSYQWKIWGPHNRGVTLCESHASRLGSTSPSNLLFMMLAATPPSPRVRHRIYNVYRLRRIINNNRHSPISFHDLYNALQPIEKAVESLGYWPSKNYQKMRERIGKALKEIPRLETEFLSQVRSFYSQELGYQYSSQILGLEIEDCYRHPRKPTRYRVTVRISGANKGPFIGSGGQTVQKLESRYNLSVDIQ